MCKIEHEIVTVINTDHFRRLSDVCGHCCQMCVCVRVCVDTAVRCMCVCVCGHCCQMCVCVCVWTLLSDVCVCVCVCVWTLLSDVRVETAVTVVLLVNEHDCYCQEWHGKHKPYNKRFNGVCVIRIWQHVRMHHCHRASFEPNYVILVTTITTKLIVKFVGFKRLV